MLGKTPEEPITFKSVSERIASSAALAAVREVGKIMAAGIAIVQSVDKIGEYFDFGQHKDQYQKFYKAIGDERLDVAITNVMNRLQLVFNDYILMLSEQDCNKLIRHMVLYMGVALDKMVLNITHQEEFKEQWQNFSHAEKQVHVEKELFDKVFNPIQLLEHDHCEQVYLEFNNQKGWVSIATILAKAPFHSAERGIGYRQVTDKDGNQKNVTNLPMLNGDVFDAAREGKDFQPLPNQSLLVQR